jgi:FkbM family methyltransferase
VCIDLRLATTAAFRTAAFVTLAVHNRGDSYVIKIGGLFFPDTEHHFLQYGDDVVNYQKTNREAAYKYVKDWRRALDVGASVGIFARDFATRFEEVVAFEPMPLVRECLAANVPANVRIEGYAVADKPAKFDMYRSGSAGGAFITNHPQVVPPDSPLKSGRTVEVEARTLDSFEFDFVGLIKMDIQGAEYPALIGARETILRHRPVLLIEEKPFNAQSAAFVQKTSELLISYGLSPKEKAQGDRIYVFDE